MKKLLTLTIIAAVMLAGGAAALSVLPHAHGDDLDHTQHPNCPVHQAQGIVLAGFISFVVFLLVLLRSRFEPQSVSSSNLSFLSSPNNLRAPPVSY